MSSSSENVRKVVLLGNGSVGKSSLISRFVDDGFSRVYKQTVGLDFFEKMVDIRNNLRIRLQLWDVGGQSVGSKMLGKYLYGAHVLVLCYDLTDAKSFSDLEDWALIVQRRYGKVLDKVKRKTFLLGNKLDLVNLRQVSSDQHIDFVKEHKLDGGYFVSARNGDKVLKSFYQMAALSCGVRLSQYELAFTERVLKASVEIDGRVEDEQKSDYIRKIEEEDRLAEESKRRQLDRRRRASCIVM